MKSRPGKPEGYIGFSQWCEASARKRSGHRDTVMPPRTPRPLIYDPVISHEMGHMPHGAEPIGLTNRCTLLDATDGHTLLER